MEFSLAKDQKLTIEFCEKALCLQASEPHESGDMITTRIHLLPLHQRSVIYGDSGIDDHEGMLLDIFSSLVNDNYLPQSDLPPITDASIEINLVGRSPRRIKISCRENGAVSFTIYGSDPDTRNREHVSLLIKPPTDLKHPESKLSFALHEFLYRSLDM